MNDFVLIIGSYFAVILIGIGITNWLSGGFIIQFARVKMSRGRFTLVRVRGFTGDYFRPGEIMEGWLVFKDLQKQRRRISCPDKSVIVYAMGVKTIDIDDEKNYIIKNDYSGVSGFDPVKYENLYIRALTAPQLDNKMMMIILIVTILTLLGVIVCGFMIFKLGGRVDALNQIKEVVQNVV